MAVRSNLVGIVAWLCAVFMVGMNGAGAAQTEVLLPAPAVNSAFSYPDIGLWDSAQWTDGKSGVTPITAWIATHQRDTSALYKVAAEYRDIQSFVGNSDYNWKTESISDPAVMQPLARLGLRADIREGGGFAIFVAPEKVLADKSHKVPIVLVPCVVEKMDVFWAMNTLVRYRRYNELVARRGDFIVVYVVTDKASAGRGSPFNVIDTATDVYRGDYQHLLLDVSTLQDNHVKVTDIPGAGWPDANIEHVGFIPVLNVAGKWAAKPSPGIGVARSRSDLRYDPQRVVHGMLGQHWIEGISFLHSHGKDSDPAIKAHFEQLGLVLSEHHSQGERWVLISPRVAVEQKSKLPLVLILSEVNDYEEYAVSTAYADYLEWFKLAAQGELNILLFARESPETMDMAYDIVKEAEHTAPIDPNRVYVTGHSHNGHLSREFAYRHPDMVAAVAPLGNSSGLAAPAYSHEAVVADDARITAWSKIDMPVITIGAASEVTSPHTQPSSILNDYDLFIEAWQRRLTASRAPTKTRAEVMAAEHSDDYVTRVFGLPNDGSALEVIDGVEHYIIDVKNVDGRKHLRIVGVDNMVHTTEPTMPMLAWNFMRRFARDQSTGKVIELY